MEEEIINFIHEKKLSPFNDKKTIIKWQKSIFKTNDARSVANKFFQHLSSDFNFAETSNIFSFFEFSDSEKEIKKRQDFFRGLKAYSNSFLSNLGKNRIKWKVPYILTTVTENEQTFMELKSRGVPVRLLLSDGDISSLEQYDLVYAIDCEEYGRALEQINSVLFVSNVDDIYLERYLVELSMWKADISMLISQNLPDKVRGILEEASSLFPLLENANLEKIDRQSVEKSVEIINNAVESKLHNLTISGSQMVALMQKGALPQQINSIINEEINRTGLPSHFFTKNLPVQIDEEELDKALRKQSANSSIRFARQLLKEKNTLQKIPALLSKLSDYIIYIDFVGGLRKHIETASFFPEVTEEILINDAQNKLLVNAQKISFNLSKECSCSILTGANSGGKTTLLEHIIHLIVEMQLGLPVKHTLRLPLFSEVYYFAKNKGSASKGAFETLLTELSTIKPGKQTIILADEVEAVTEPGVAGEIMKASIEYFVPKGCFMVLATHLGKELQHNLPKGARIDGIEASGLDSEFNLIVNHNPVLGRLARSTPELIVEKMAKSQDSDYLNHLYASLKSRDALV